MFSYITRCQFQCGEVSFIFSPPGLIWLGFPRILLERFIVIAGVLKVHNVRILTLSISVFTDGMLYVIYCRSGNHQLAPTVVTSRLNLCCR